MYNIRKYKGRAVPIPNKNGVAKKHYAFMLQPEDPTNIGFYIEKTTVSVDDTFTANDGAIWAIQHDALTATSGNTVKWGTVAIANGTGDAKTLSFTETQLAEGQETATTVSGSVVVLS